MSACRIGPFLVGWFVGLGHLAHPKVKSFSSLRPCGPAVMAAIAGTKRSAAAMCRAGGSVTGTCDPHTVAGWGTAGAGRRVQDLLTGFHDGASEEERKAARHHVVRYGMIRCRKCGKDLEAHRGHLLEHVASRACLNSTSAPSAFFWLQAAKTEIVPLSTDETVEMEKWFVLVCESNGLSPTTAAAMFERGSPVLRYLQHTDPPPCGNHRGPGEGGDHKVTQDGRDG